MIAVSDLSFKYADQPFKALDDISLEIRKGEMVLISGSTGCGKSTLGLVLAGAIPNLIPGTIWGSVSINGETSFSQPVSERAKQLGFLMQNVEYQFFTDKVFDEVAFGLENFRVPPEEIPAKVEEVLNLVGAGKLINRSFRKLSAGEKQRVMLAALLSLNQNTLVLDEPLAYLDKEGQRSLVELLSRLVQRGKTIIVFEHRREPFKRVFPREIWMKEGRISSETPCEEFFGVLETYSSGSTVLAYENVSFSWGDENPLFEGISFEIREGESLVLLGKNGSGKTTLMNLAVGLLKPLKGRVVTCGYDTSRGVIKDIADKVAFVFQLPDHQIYFSKVLDEVLLGATSRDAAYEELKALGLSELSERHPRSLSMGQKRRLTIASSLARAPKLMLLDEPSVGQDDLSLAMMVRRLNRYLENGGALLIATHDDRVAKAFGHNVVELGEIR
ncbi:MAG: ABC transporter ATP-binding protein [Thermodesulforhabdaceae bacterium]